MVESSAVSPSTALHKRLRLTPLVLLTQHELTPPPPPPKGVPNMHYYCDILLLVHAPYLQVIRLKLTSEVHVCVCVHAMHCADTDMYRAALKQVLCPQTASLASCNTALIHKDRPV